MATVTSRSPHSTVSSQSTKAHVPTHVLRHGLAVRSRHASLTALEAQVPFALPPPKPSPHTPLRPFPKDPVTGVDDVNLGNPLQRAERLGTGWFGVILDLDGVVLDYDFATVSARSWQRLAEEEGRAPLPAWALRKAEHMKNEQVIQEVFEWAWNRREVARLAQRREELYAEGLASMAVMANSGMIGLLDMLDRLRVPVAVVSSAPRRRAIALLEHAGLAPRFGTLVTSEDVVRGPPDPASYFSASLAIGRPPARCVVLVSGNLSIEAAREAGMKVVALAASRPAYELVAADVVVRDAAALAAVDFKRLFAHEPGAELLSQGAPEQVLPWAAPVPFSDADV